jgi:hypothetical protein
MIKAVNKSFENVEKFKYAGQAVINQYYIHDQVTKRLNTENPCCHFDQNLCLSLSYPQT